jgi:hypothetical protein
MAGRFSALRTSRFLPLGRFLLLIFARGWIDPRAIVRLEGLGKLKKSTSSGTQTSDLLACSIVPQPTTLLRAPIYMSNSSRIWFTVYDIQKKLIYNDVKLALWFNMADNRNFLTTFRKSLHVEYKVRPMGLTLIPNNSRKPDMTT